jgi:hypothetical protein
MLFLLYTIPFWTSMYITGCWKYMRLYVTNDAITRVCSERERERDIYILPWLQVRITGPRHHLTSSLRNYAQGYDKTGCYLQYVSSMVSRVRCPALYVIW